MGISPQSRNLHPSPVHPKDVAIVNQKCPVPLGVWKTQVSD